MGFILSRRKSRPTKRDRAAINLNQRLNFRPFNYSDIKVSFLAHAYPDAPIFANRALFPTECSPDVVRDALERFAAGELPADDLTKLVFGMPSIAHFADQVFLANKTTCGAASQATLKALEAARWSLEWEQALDETEVDRYVWDCLGDLGTRPATHSGLAHDGWRHRDPFAIPYANAAKIGFLAVALPFNLSNSTFNWKHDRTSREKLLSTVVIPCPSVPNPLDVLPEELRSAVQRRCEQIAVHLTGILGRSNDTVTLPTSLNPVPFKESLNTAAQHGAMLAAVGIDPSACRVYTEINGSRQLLDVEELPWLVR